MPGLALPIVASAGLVLAVFKARVGASQPEIKGTGVLDVDPALPRNESVFSGALAGSGLAPPGTNSSGTGSSVLDVGQHIPIAKKVLPILVGAMAIHGGSPPTDTLNLPTDTLNLSLSNGLPYPEPKAGRSFELTQQPYQQPYQQPACPLPHRSADSSEHSLLAYLRLRAEYLGSGISNKAWLLPPAANGTRWVVKLLKGRKGIMDTVTWDEDDRPLRALARTAFDNGLSMTNDGGRGIEGAKYFTKSIFTNIGESADKTGDCDPDDPPFVIYEYGGLDLGSFLEDSRENKTWTAEKAWSIVRQLLEALVYLRHHPHHWIHHDLHPENVGVVESRGGDLSIRIFDFDNSLRGVPEEQLQADDRALCRSGYRPPEDRTIDGTKYHVAFGVATVPEENSFRVAQAYDMYALGVLTLLLVLPMNPDCDTDKFGPLCFGISSPIGTEKQINAVQTALQDQISFPAGSDPKNVLRLFVQCLNKAPSKRPDPESILAALDPANNALPVAASF